MFLADFGTDAPSHMRNRARDVLPLCTYRLVVDSVMPGVTPELRAHLEPSFATTCGLWRGMGRVGHLQMKANQKNEGTSVSEKSKGKQKARESEVEVEDIMKKNDQAS